jgi:hypothetical protein
MMSMNLVCFHQFLHHCELISQTTWRAFLSLWKIRWRSRVRRSTLWRWRVTSWHRRPSPQSTKALPWYGLRAIVLSSHVEVNILNAIGFTHVSLGNHEFDLSLEVLLNRIPEVQCPVLTSNIRSKVNKHNLIGVSCCVASSGLTFSWHCRLRFVLGQPIWWAKAFYNWLARVLHTQD